MHIDIIETSSSLASLEDNWNAVYDADDEAQIFLSWKWLNGWLASIKGPWFILAAKAHNSRRCALCCVLSVAAGKPDRGIRRRPARCGWRAISPPITPASFAARCGKQGHSGLCPRHQADELGAACTLKMSGCRSGAGRLLLAYFPKANFGMTEVNTHHQGRPHRQQSLSLHHAAEGLGDPICLVERQYEAKDPASPEAGRCQQRISDNGFDAGDVRAGSQDPAAVLGDQMASAQGRSGRQPGSQQWRHAEAQFSVRPGVPADLLARRPARRGAGHADGSAQADLFVLHNRARRDV